MNNKKYDVLSFGEILMKLAPTANERLNRGNILEKQIGGAELNVLCGTAMLGLKSGVISKIPAHSIGIFARNCARAVGVSDEFLVYDTEKDARLGLYYYESGAYPRKPGVIYDRLNSSVNKFSVEELPQEIFTSTKCFHTSGITLGLGGKCREEAIKLIKKFKEKGALISFDVNFRSNLWTGPQAKECIEEILPYVDIFFCSKSTAELTFLKTGDIKEITKSFAKEFNIKYVTSTNRTVHSPKSHSFGSVFYNAEEDKYYEEKDYENIEIVDRIGSGDAYIAGALYGLLCENGSCQKAMECGNAFSAIKNTVIGDIPSCNEKELEEIIREHKSTGFVSEMNR